MIKHVAYLIAYRAEFISWVEIFAATRLVHCNLKNIEIYICLNNSFNKFMHR